MYQRRAVSPFPPASVGAGVATGTFPTAASKVDGELPFVTATLAEVLTLESHLPSNVVFDEKEVLGMTLGLKAEPDASVALALDPTAGDTIAEASLDSTAIQSAIQSELSSVQGISAALEASVQEGDESKSLLNQPAFDVGMPSSSSIELQLPPTTHLGSAPAPVLIPDVAPSAEPVEVIHQVLTPVPEVDLAGVQMSKEREAGEIMAYRLSDGAILDSILDGILGDIVRESEADSAVLAVSEAVGSIRGGKKLEAAPSGIREEPATESELSGPSPVSLQEAPTANAKLQTFFSMAPKTDAPDNEDQSQQQLIPLQFAPASRFHPMSAPTRDAVQRATTPTTFRPPGGRKSGGSKGSTWHHYSGQSSVNGAISDDEDDDEGSPEDDDGWGDSEEDEYFGTTSGLDETVIPEGEMELLTVSPTVRETIKAGA